MNDFFVFISSHSQTLLRCLSSSSSLKLSFRHLLVSTVTSTLDLPPFPGYLLLLPAYLFDFYLSFCKQCSNYLSRLYTFSYFLFASGFHEMGAMGFRYRELDHSLPVLSTFPQHFLLLLLLLSSIPSQSCPSTFHPTQLHKDI